MMAALVLLVADLWPEQVVVVVAAQPPAQAPQMAAMEAANFPAPQRLAVVEQAVLALEHRVILGQTQRRTRKAGQVAVAAQAH